MNKVLLLIVSVFFLHSLSSAQAKTKLLQGTIQNYPILMELSVVNDSECFARYFYAKERKDIEMQGSVDADGSMHLNTESWGSEDTNRISEKFDLRQMSNAFTGTWMNHKKQLPVELKEVIIDDYKNPFDPIAFIKTLKETDPYNYIRTADFEFMKDSSTQENNCTLDWYHEKFSGIVLFRISKGFEADAIKKINEQLTETQLQESNSLLECSSPFGRGEYDQQVQHIFIGENVMSVNLFTSYDCGGAHPDFGSSALNFDTHSGKLLQLDDFLWLNKKQNPKENSEEWNTYREKVFAPKIVSLLSQLYPQNMKKPVSDDEGCDYSNPEVWSFPNWYFTSKGIYVGATFPRVLRPCDEPEWPVIRIVL